MTFEDVERKARELCKFIGLDPDGLGYDGVVWPEALWHAYIPLTRDVLCAEPQVEESETPLSVGGQAVGSQALRAD